MRAPISPKKTLWVTGFVILALAAFFLLRPVFQPKVECISLFSYLSGQSVEAVTLNLDLQAVYGKDSADFPAVLSWVEKDGKNISLPVEISVRGKNRRDVCTFPPLKLSVAETKELGISKGGSKLVTHCTEGNGETLLMREYLAYRLYAGLTDASFRTRLIKVTYQDRDGDKDPVDSWAILLESKDDLMKRLDAEEADVEGPVKEISAEDYNRFAVFQFMIGNTDWNLNNQHNVKLLVPRKGGLPFPVPYDFDRSGLVNAPYADPAQMLPIQTVRERFFQWRGKDRKQLEPVLELFKQRQEDLMGICWDFDALSVQDRQDITQFLEEFFLKMDMLLTEGRTMAHSEEEIPHRAG